MATKSELSKRIVAALIREQRHPKPFSDRISKSAPLRFPPQLPVGNGRFLPTTEAALRDISDYGSILRSNDPALAQSHSDEQISSIVGRAFGGAFALVDIDQPQDDIHEQTLAGVAEYLAAELAPNKHEEEFAFGCWALTGAGTEDLQIGPVRIEAREKWLAREEDAGRISEVAARRIRKKWGGGKVGRRKPTMDREKERAVLNMAEECSTICSVATKGLSQKVAEHKASLAARLAFTALALSWESPARALDRMGLRIDGPIYLKYAVSFAPTHMSGLFSRTSHIGGQFVTKEWLAQWPSLGWLVGPLGDALCTYVQPNEPTLRPKINNALFMSLWWFHEACREQAPLLAIVKFAASLDALASGGKARGIQELINSRLAIKPGDALMTDGRTTAEVVKVIYSDARSQAIHGSTGRHGHDWQRVRQLAERLARLCLSLCCDWISTNPHSDDPVALRRPDPSAI